MSRGKPDSFYVQSFCSSNGVKSVLLDGVKQCAVFNPNFSCHDQVNWSGLFLTGLDINVKTAASNMLNIEPGGSGQRWTFSFISYLRASLTRLLVYSKSNLECTEVYVPQTDRVLEIERCSE